MQLIYRLSAVVFLCSVLGYLNADEVFKHKDWLVTTYPDDSKYIKYSTHGTAVWGHEFGFLKTIGDCKADNLYVGWSSTKNINQLKRMQSKKVLFDLKPDDNFEFNFAIPNLLVDHLWGMKDLELPTPLNVMLFTNYYPKYTFIPTLEAGRKISVNVSNEDPHLGNFDIPDDQFSLEGYIAARQYAMELCEIRTKALETINQYEVTMR
jgi:hypothetical protein